MSIKMHEMSKTYQYRKVMKPLLERKRRARINKCLDELKDLMSECLAQQGENIVRLEKADILELTVDHLRRLRRNENTINSNSLSSTNDQSFRSGYVYAANEVSRALACYPGVDISLGTRVMAHLGHSLVQIENQKQEIITTTKSPLNSPLKVYCGSHINNINAEINYTNINCNYNSPIQQLSPSASSGYGSDNESVSPSLSISHHHCNDHHQGLLKIAATSFTVQPSITKKENNVNVWRPW